ncbi:unnamed protein product, partial [Laminaria digitata]
AAVFQHQGGSTWKPTAHRHHRRSEVQRVHSTVPSCSPNFVECCQLALFLSRFQ